MDILKLFNRRNEQFIDLLPNVLSNEKDQGTEKAILTAINTRLDHATTFHAGLCLLDKFVPQISKESFLKYFSHWISKLTQKLSNSHNNLQDLTAVCKSLGLFITSCKQVPELDKRVSLYHIKPIISIIVEQYHQNKNLNLINLLMVFLYHYPESCARLQASFNGIITASIDCEDNGLVNAGAKCYSLLIRANERSFIQLYKDNYIILPDNSSASCHIYYQINLCHYLHDIMNELLQNFVTTTSELPPELQQARKNYILDLPEISQDSVLVYYAANINRFSNICTFLSTLLKTGSTGKKFVLPNVILHVICRGLSITPVNIQKSNESRKSLLLLVLPKLYISIMNVLEALITSFQQELVPFAHNIQKLMIQTLEWTQSYNEPFRNVRLLAYKVISVWVEQTQSLSSFETFSEELLPHLQRDLSQTNDQVFILKANKKSSKSNSKVEKPVATQDVRNDTDTINTSNSDEALHLQVLSTIEVVVSNVNYCLKQSFCDQIRNIVISLLYEQYTKKFSILQDKTSVQYRLQLLRTLRVLELNVHSSNATSHAIHIFGLAVSQEHNSEIVKEARLGLAELRQVVYPTAPTLMLPLTDNSEEAALPRTLQITESFSNQLIRQNTEIRTNDDAVECKRARIEEKPVSNSVNSVSNGETKKEEEVVNNTAVINNGENKCNGDVEEDDNDNEMILAFCDEQSNV